MKYNNQYLLYILLAGFSLLPSCKKWLAVTPATSIAEEEQFSSQQGFSDALFGLYQKAADSVNYGRNLTWGMLDVLAQRYENKSIQTSNYYGQIARYVYDNGAVTTGQFSGFSTLPFIWSNQYNIIAQANYILKNVDARKAVLPGNAYNIVKGEALAMRGFLHFDLLRMFAPAYLEGANAGAPAIPYMTAFTVVPQAKSTVLEVLNKCEQDLKDAEALLAVYPNIDQIAGNQGSTSLELFLLYRQNHLNYWAVKGLLARLYLYKGDKANALKYAKDVIDSKRFTFIKQGSINSDETNDASDMTFSSEHIFSIYVTYMKSLADNWLKNSVSTGGDATDLFSTRTKLDAIYETSQAGYGTDVRCPSASKSLWFQLSANVVYTKKYYADRPTNVKQRIIPIIKLAEMYYIAAEAAATVDEGVGYLNVVRTARLIPALPNGLSATALNDELLKEYRKEFYGEGQLWFYYKRRNTVNIPDGVGNPMTANKYVFPYPLSEIEFGK